MTSDLKSGLALAGARMREGDLMAATRAIQAALGKGEAAAPGDPPGMADAAGAGGRARRPLGEVVKDLAGRMKPGKARDLAIPEGAQWLAGTFEGPHGRRGYRLYIPARPADGPRPLVVMLHGCTQDAADFAAGTGMNAHAEKAGVAVLWPEQDRGANVMGCWNWFEPQHQGAEGGEPAILAGMIRALATEHGFDLARVFVAGLSAGGAMAAVMGESHPELVRAIGVHSGLPAGHARSMPEGMALMRQGPAGDAGTRARRIVLHGDADGTVAAANGHALAAGIAGETERGSTNGRGWTRTRGKAGEFWLLHGGSHAWSGGHAGGSYTDAAGPDASALMLDFFMGLDDGAKGAR